MSSEHASGIASASEKDERQGRFHKAVTFLSYIYLLRIPILIALTLIALPPLALWGPLKSLLENLFVLDVGNIFWVMIVALVLAWSLLVVSRVVLLNGRERFGIDQWMKHDTLRSWHLLIASLPTLSLLICAFIEKTKHLTELSPWRWILAASAGTVAAYAFGFLAILLSLTLAPRYHPDDPNKSPENRFQIPFPYSKELLHWAGNFRLIRVRDSNMFGKWVLENVPKDLRTGYTDERGQLYPGHWLVLMLMVISVILYISLGSFRGYRLGLPTSIPAVTYVFILLLVLNWVLSTVTFFLDRYRIPLLLLIVLFCVLAGQFPQSDHYFSIRDGILVPPVSPAATVANHAKRHNGKVIVVATAGGGIQAAGWTARVLTGLQEQCVNDYQTNFADSIAAISAVSGGAVGTLFFMNQYEVSAVSPGFHLTRKEELEKIIDQSEAPALSDVAWALAYVEPPRMLFPYFRNSEEQRVLDRGYVLEQTWRNQGSVYAYLSNWREGVTEGWRPAVIFNSTIAETGQPFLLSTSDFNTGTTSPARQTFTGAYPNSDLPVVTATRLAASFPYVSPASRALTSKPEYHFVDGGYYDNYGVDSLVAWLGQALLGIPNKELQAVSGIPDKKLDVLLIQIRSFPTNAFPGPKSRGWFYQSYAPVEGLINVRTTAQLVRDREQLELLKSAWQEDVKIETATFEFPGDDAPLSWEMNQQQKSSIEREWANVFNDPKKKNELDKVREFCSALREQAKPASSK